MAKTKTITTTNEKTKIIAKSNTIAKAKTKSIKKTKPKKDVVELRQSPRKHKIETESPRNKIIANQRSSQPSSASNTNSYVRPATLKKFPILKDEFFKKLLELGQSGLKKSKSKIQKTFNVTSANGKKVEFISHQALKFSKIRGIEVAVYPSSQSNKKYGVLRIPPGKKKPLSEATGNTQFLMMGSTMTFVIDKVSAPAKNGNLVTVPKGIRYSINNDTDSVGLVTFITALK